MKKSLFAMLIVLQLLYLDACSQGQNAGFNLDAESFDKKLKATAQAQIIDVRSPQEFSGGRIANAVNINYNGNDFEERVAQLDKKKPVFVYCLSGGRSQAAANYMRKNGFQEVYELRGGVVRWQALNKPLTSGVSNTNTQANTKKAGITEAQFKTMIQSEKPILIDFSAQWCAPCKKMKPFLEKLTQEFAQKASIVIIDFDENEALGKAQNVQALPTLMLFQKGKKLWQKEGFASEDELRQLLTQYTKK